MKKNQVLVHSSVIDDFYYEVPVEDFESVIWFDTNAGEFAVRQLGYSLYGQIPLNVVNGDPKYA
ncbi:MAG: hypothetical protein K5644_07530, partial [Lachnospiraceae bacterium]|nr:hypothetical protein [Lachnospiraceae bacterium]